MEKFDLIEQIKSGIAWLMSGGFITAIVIKKMGKRKEEVEIAFTESETYRNIIAELKADREENKIKIVKLTEQVTSLKNEIRKFIELNKEKDEIIESQKRNIASYNATCERLEKIAIEDRKKLEQEKRKSEQLKKELKKLKDEKLSN